ncbi:type II secretion system F family protein [Pectinatus haikarae]|uniref:Type IV pilus assembly protein PilC n=1 Tax=Pectinatus haikarae TaxID=349096 RepID=A0ABT9Y8M1_9FIRM|nr:type II secretion system F family protein [Pectinatus haikarae]MDQ0204190.1 type IV pilus assembly protein PilC [Pectinatus haikarae]
MKKYFYCVKDHLGKDIKGSIFAASPDEAAEILRSQNYFLLGLEEEKCSLRQRLKGRFGYIISCNDVAFFCRQLSIMLKSGITVKEALEAINAQTKNIKFKNILYEISLQIQTGKSFSDSLAVHKTAFPRSFLALTAAGEAGGKLDDVLQYSADYLERDYNIREKLKTVAVYPLMLSLVFIVTAGVMLTVVMPMFAELLKNLNVPLPLLTTFVLFLGFGLEKYGIVFIMLFLSLLSVFNFMWQQKKYKYMVYKFLLKTPFWGRLFAELILLQFCNELSVMLSSGLTIDKSISTILSNSPNEYLENILKRVQADIQRGNTLSSSLAKNTLFTPLFMQMLLTGEKSGNLAIMLNTTAEFYKNDVELLYKRGIALAEPCMIIALSIFIGIFVAAIAIPMFEAAAQVPM